MIFAVMQAKKGEKKQEEQPKVDTLIQFINQITEFPI